MSKSGIVLSGLVCIATVLDSANGHAQTGNAVWVSLPRNVDLPDEFSNNGLTELTYLDTRAAGKIRIYYTTQGHFDITPPDVRIWPGTLRPVDLPPIPDLFGKFGEWADPDIEIQASVANWNKVLDTTAVTEDLYFGKRGSLNGMIATEGDLFVAITQRHDWGIPPDPTQVFDNKRGWNGLALLDGWANPSVSFNPPDVGHELFSTGLIDDVDHALYDHDDFPALGDGGMREAVPEGVTIIETSPPGAGVHRYFSVADYCGRDAAGHVLIQNINSIDEIDPEERYMIPVYELLADWLESTNAPPPGPLGHEVHRSFFTCPLDAVTQLPQCADGNHDIRGNKIRPLVSTKILASVPINGGKILLFIGINLDPIDPPTYGDPQPLRLDDIGVTPTSRDDGKYDYIAVVDATYLVKTIPNPAYHELWLYTDPAGWREHTRFIRLPPDVGSWSFDPEDPEAWPTDPGADWSFVTVPHPTGAEPPQQIRVLGSGTPKTMAVSPAFMNSAGVRKQYLYVVTSDQGQEGVVEQLSDDGGLHVPHVFTIDLGLVDLSDQAAINAQLTNPAFIKSYRINKVVKAHFSGGVDGAVAIEDQLGQPGSTQTLASGANESDIGTYYPGEFQFEPTARARMHFVRNTELASDPNRIYIGTTGESQDSASNAASEVGWLERLGTVLVLKVDADGVPSYRETLTLQQPAPHFYAVSALDVVPKMWLEAPTDRNVVIVGALDKLGPNESPARQDRIILMQNR